MIESNFVLLVKRFVRLSTNLNCFLTPKLSVAACVWTDARVDEDDDFSSFMLMTMTVLYFHANVGSV